MSHLNNFTLILIVVIGVGVLALLWSMPARDDDNTSTEITSFSQCVKAGGTIMESYPRQCRTEDGSTFTEDIGNELEKRNIIRIDSPRPNETVTSPLTLSGEARGQWFFEASFSVELIDANGNKIAEHFVEATDEWMTEDFVPFQGTLSFTPPETEEGTLILHRANPSGLPENAAELRVPVRFK